MRVLAITLFDDCVLGGSRVSISLTPSFDQRSTPLLPPVAPAVVGVPPPAVVAVVAAAVGCSAPVAVAPAVPPVVAVAAPGAFPGVGVDSPVHATSSMGVTNVANTRSLPGLLSAFLQYLSIYALLLYCP